MKSRTRFFSRAASFLATLVLSLSTFYSASAITLSTVPLFLSQGAEPIVMLNMSKDHQLYFKAYDDYTDLDGDGIPDTTYKNSVDYYGYFDSYKCYKYQNSRFEPDTITTDKYCNSGVTTGQWSGNFLNWATMTRMDAVRKILYGGMRSTDSSTETVLERSYLPTDAHSFAKYYGGSDIARLVGITATAGTTQTSGITLCNTTYDSSAFSQSVTNAPKIRAVAGNYSLWASNERWQCTWSGEHGASNGNDSTASGIPAYSSNPDAGSGQEYNARVKVCVTNLIGRENCKSYPSGALKPIGLLQKYGDNNDVKFGLLTGTYDKNKSGGMIRKNAAYFSNEVDVNGNGSFVSNAGGIVDNINKLRIYGYRHSDGTYFGDTNADNCSWGRSSFPNGECSNWGNPQSEIYLESLRYLAGKTATTAYSANDASRIAGITAPSWTDPIDSNNYCAALNVIQFNASTSSYDGDDLAGATDIGLTDVDAATNAVGAGEGIHTNNYFVGENGTDNNQLCTAKTVTTLSAVRGTCPDAPRLEGTYKIAGLAKYARTNQLRTSPANTKRIKTYGVALAPAVPKIEIPVPGSTGKKVTILPACRNTSLSPAGNCSIVDFKVVSQTSSASVNSGVLYVNWEDSEQGGDYDQDMWGMISYSVSATNTTVSTQVIAQSTPYVMGFGYILSGTNDDGFHVQSGINSFSLTGSGCTTAAPCSVGGSAITATYSIGSSIANLLQQPLWYAAKWGGFNDSDNSGTPNLATEWDSDGDGKPDTYNYAISPAQLETSLGSAIEAVIAESGSASAVATNSTRLDNGTTIYQARFSSVDWSGQLIAYAVNTNGTVGAQQWDAGDAGKIPAPASRNVFTYNPTTSAGVALAWGNLSSAQQLALRAGGETTDTNAQVRLNWLLGARDNEEPNGLALRKRTKLLGDIVNSDPVYSGGQDFRYENLPALDPDGSTASGNTTYQTYVTGTKRTRQAVIFVGANDGFLHAINASTGAEMFAYMPAGVFSNIINITKPNYGASTNPHQYYVDGSLFVGDAYIGGSWRTILVGSTGAGSQSIFALDVTDPANFTAANILFDKNSTANTDLGNVLGQPLVVKMADGRWAAVLGNGYNSPNAQHASLLVVNLASPYSVMTIPTDTSIGANGMSGVSVVASGGIAQWAFAGDLQGNMWKFDLTDTSASGGLNWESAYKSGTTPKPLFKAKDGGGAAQPITAAPVIGTNPQRSNKYMVYFGTGQYLATNDNVVGSTPQLQSVYGILDDGAIATNYTSRTSIPLAQKTISTQTTTTRTVSEGTVNWASVKGWFMDLKNPSDTNGVGERVVSKALLLYDRLLLTTLIPSNNPCAFGGSGWLMEVGGVGDSTATFSLLGSDGIFQQYAVPKLSSFIKGGESGYIPTSNIRGDINIVPTDLPVGAGGRQSWRQLR